jgi:hypothetical protein
LIGETLNSTGNINREEAGLGTNAMNSSATRFKNRSLSKPTNSTTNAGQGLPPSASQQAKLNAQSRRFKNTSSLGNESTPEDLTLLQREIQNGRMQRALGGSLTVNSQTNPSNVLPQHSGH